MEIRQPAPHVLELTDRGALLLKLGAIVIGFGLIAACFALFQHRAGIAVLVLALFGSAGAVCLVHARRVTHVIDTRRGILTIAAQPLLGAERPTVVEQHRLADLAAIELEARESSDADGSTSTVYRVSYVFNDGNRRPWSQVWTSSRRSHEEPRNAVVEFLTRAGYLAGRLAREA